MSTVAADILAAMIAAGAHRLDLTLTPSGLAIRHQYPDRGHWPPNGNWYLPVDRLPLPAAPQYREQIEDLRRACLAALHLPPTLPPAPAPPFETAAAASNAPA